MLATNHGPTATVRMWIGVDPHGPAPAPWRAVLDGRRHDRIPPTGLDRRPHLVASCLRRGAGHAERPGAKLRRTAVRRVNASHGHNSRPRRKPLRPRAFDGPRWRGARSIDRVGAPWSARSIGAPPPVVGAPGSAGIRARGHRLFTHGCGGYRSGCCSGWGREQRPEKIPGRDPCRPCRSTPSPISPDPPKCRWRNHSRPGGSASDPTSRRARRAVPDKTDNNQLVGLSRWAQGVRVPGRDLQAGITSWEQRRITQLGDSR